MAGLKHMLIGYRMLHKGDNREVKEETDIPHILHMSTSYVEMWMILCIWHPSTDEEHELIRDLCVKLYSSSQSYLCILEINGLKIKVLPYVISISKLFGSSVPFGSVADRWRKCGKLESHYPIRANYFLEKVTPL